eukprot:3451605-Prymnesium_polylepis.1
MTSCLHAQMRQEIRCGGAKNSSADGECGHRRCVRRRCCRIAARNENAASGATAPSMKRSSCFPRTGM